LFFFVFEGLIERIDDILIYFGWEISKKQIRLVASAKKIILKMLQTYSLGTLNRTRPVFGSLEGSWEHPIDFQAL
jgi:hypothetical protein